MTDDDHGSAPAPTSTSTDSAEERAPMTLTQKTGVSLALVLTIIAGIVANVSMMFSLRGDVALVQRDVSHIVGDVSQVRTSMGALANDTRRDTSALQVQVATLQAQLNELATRVREIEHK